MMKNDLLKFLRRFLLFIVLMILVIIVPSVWYFYHLPVDYQTNGLAAIIDKHHRLSEIRKPKIIIVGGSGCGMGINSAMIDSAFPGYEVVNMGLFGQLGLCYMMNEVKADVHQGDIVLVIPEYQQFYYQYYGDLGLLRIMRIYPEGLKYLSSPKQAVVLAQNFAPYLISQVRNNYENAHVITDQWNRKFVNEYGDFCGHLHFRDSIDVSAFPLFASSKDLKMNTHVIDEMNKFNDQMIEKHARMLFMFPSIPTATFDRNDSLLKCFDKEVRKKAEFPVLNTINSSNFDADYFFDTVYHMNSKGRDARTLNLIFFLKEWMNTHQDS